MAASTKSTARGVFPEGLDTVTRTNTGTVVPSDAVPVPALTVLWHPDPERVGERAYLPVLLSGDSAVVSRLAPPFAPPGGGMPRPLADARLSRRPLHIVPAADGAIVLDPSELSMPLLVNGEPVSERRDLDRETLGRGVVLLLAERVALVLRTEVPATLAARSHGLIGESAAMVRVRERIERVADLGLSVLVRGATGTGKELVAQAIHQAGPRRDGPCVTVHLGAIPAELTAAELFGAARGAYTGAVSRRDGYFRQADGGTLFLDEVATAPPETQTHLLRALESGEIQPVGGAGRLRVDVRVVAATDSDLEMAVESGTFSAPLLHRLRSYEIELPPLSERREDFGRLFLHFLRQELARVDEAWRLRPVEAAKRPWASAELVSRLALCSWPGNVRQLRTVVQQLVVESRGRPRLEIPPTVRRVLASAEASQARDTAQGSAATNGDVASSQTPAAAEPRYRHPSSVDEDELVAALRAERFNVRRAARRLGMSPTALYKRIDACARIRKASEIGAEEVAATLAEHDGDLEATAAALEVSVRGLQQRLRVLGESS